MKRIVFIFSKNKLDNTLEAGIKNMLPVNTSGSSPALLTRV